MQRYTNSSPIAYNLFDTTGTSFNYALTGSGYDTQLSYIFKNNIELIGRYSYSLPGKKLEHTLVKSTSIPLELANT